MRACMGCKECTTCGVAVNGEDAVAKLEKLKTMLERRLVTQEEHDAKKAEILAHM